MTSAPGSVASEVSAQIPASSSFFSQLLFLPGQTIEVPFFKQLENFRDCDSKALGVILPRAGSLWLCNLPVLPAMLRRPQGGSILVQYLPPLLGPHPPRTALV